MKVVLRPHRLAIGVTSGNEAKEQIVGRINRVKRRILTGNVNEKRYETGGRIGHRYDARNTVRVTLAVREGDKIGSVITNFKPGNRQTGTNRSSDRVAILKPLIARGRVAGSGHCQRQLLRAPNRQRGWKVSND